jgi:hypothetical protein
MGEVEMILLNPTALYPIIAITALAHVELEGAPVRVLGALLAPIPRLV